MQTALRAIYPPRCLACGGLVESDFGLCGRCWGEAAFVAGAVCDRCGTPLPGDPGNDALICDDCLRIARPWSRGRAALLYQGTGRRLVLALKHGDRHDIAAPAGRWMARAARPLVRAETLVVPVPLHISRLIARRFNQSALLARELARALGVDWASDPLVRRVRTRSLEGQGRDARFATLADAIHPHPSRGAVLRGRPVMLVDDVMTSGATLAAAAEAAHAAGACDVCTVVLARAAKAS
ncbi:MAG: ComF family protein [Roseivivax sp.]|nr:ComF family protein [Roseivivax sp.]